MQKHSPGSLTHLWMDMRSTGYSYLSGGGWPRPYASTQRWGVPRVLRGKRFLCTEGGISYFLHKKLMVMLMDLAPALLPS
jgi:hypothetical protein